MKAITQGNFQLLESGICPWSFFNYNLSLLLILQDEKYLKRRENHMSHTAYYHSNSPSCLPYLPLHMDFLIRFGGVHETFRLVEIQALAIVENVRMEVVFYNADVCLARQTKNYTSIIFDFLLFLF